MFKIDYLFYELEDILDMYNLYPFKRELFILVFETNVFINIYNFFKKYKKIYLVIENKLSILYYFQIIYLLKKENKSFWEWK